MQVNNIRSVVIQQLTMVEARQGPWSLAMLVGGMTRLEGAPISSRPEAQTAVTSTSAPRARVISSTEVSAGSVVLCCLFPRTRETSAQRCPRGLL